MVQKLLKLKQKILKLLHIHCVDNEKKNRRKGYVSDFSVDYTAITVLNILEIDKYLMKKNEIVQKYSDM